MADSAIIEALKQQILGQGTTSKWSGEGFGSAEANAANMTDILAGIGISNINQFGQFDTTVNQNKTVQPEYTWSYPGYGDTDVQSFTGRYYIPEYSMSGDSQVETGRTFVDPKYVTKSTRTEGDTSYTDYTAAIPTTRSVYGNKVTGQAVPTTYGERQTGNAWGGTFAGSGNTGYRVQFTPDGTPLFYTTGASSNDLANLLGDNPLLSLAANVGAAYFGGPLGAAALQVAQGGDAGDAIKAAALTYGAQQIPGLFGDGGAQLAADADTAGGMVPEYGTNAAYDSFMQSAMTPEAMAAIEAGIEGPMGPLTQAELGQGFQDYMQAAGYTADTMGPMTAEQLGNSFQDYMAKEGYDSSPVSGIPKALQDALLKQLPGLFAGGLAASAAGQNIPTYTPPPAYKPQDTQPTYSPDYFNQVQNYYTGYMPNAPRDVATPLQDWYNTGYTGEDSVTKKLFGV